MLFKRDYALIKAKAQHMSAYVTLNGQNAFSLKKNQAFFFKKELIKIIAKPKTTIKSFC